MTTTSIKPIVLLEIPEAPTSEQSSTQEELIEIPARGEEDGDGPPPSDDDEDNTEEPAPGSEDGNPDPPKG